MTRILMLLFIIATVAGCTSSNMGNHKSEMMMDDSSMKSKSMDGDHMKDDGMKKDKMM